jgi:hypothetical protein
MGRGGRGLIVIILSFVLSIIVRFSVSRDARLYIVYILRNAVIWLVVGIAVSMFVGAGLLGWVRPAAKISVWLTFATIALGLAALVLWL